MAMAQNDPLQQDLSGGQNPVAPQPIAAGDEIDWSGAPALVKAPTISAPKPQAAPASQALAQGDDVDWSGAPALVQPPHSSPSFGIDKAETIGAGKPTLIQRIEAMFGAGAPQGSNLANWTQQMGQAHNIQLLTPEALATPKEQSDWPIATGFGQLFGGMSTPENIMIQLMSGGFGKVASAGGTKAILKGGGTILEKAVQLAPQLASLGFSAQTLHSALQMSPELKQAWDRGDESEVLRLGTIILGSMAFATVAAEHGFTGKPGESVTPIGKGIDYVDAKTGPMAEAAGRYVGEKGAAAAQAVGDAAAEAAAATGKAVAAPFKAASNAVADANLVQRATGPSGTLRKLFYDAIKPSSTNAREVDETLGRVEPELNRIFEDNPQVKDTPSAVAVLDREINRFGDTEKQIADNLTGDPANPNPESLMAGAKDKISAAIDNAFKGDQWGSEAQEAAKAKMLARYSDITANNGLDESEHRERTLPELQKLTRQLGQETQSKYEQADTSGEGTHLDKTTADWAARDAAARVGRELIDQKFEDLGVQGVKEWRQKQADLINVKQWLDARYGASTKKFDWFQKSIQAAAITGAGMGTGALLGPYVGIPIASVGAIRLAREYAEYRANNPNIALGRGVQRAGVGPRGPDGKPTNISKPYGPYIKDMTGQELRISSPTPDKTIEAAAVKGPQTQLAPVPRSFVEAQPGQQPSIFGGQVGDASALRSPANVDMEQLKNMVFDKLARGEQLRLTPEQIQAWWKTYGSMPPSPTAEKGQMELSPVPNSLVPVVPSPVAAEGDVLDPNKPDYTGATGAPHPSVFAEPGTLPPARPDVTPTPEELGGRPAEVQPKPIREGEVPHRQIPPRLIGRNGSTVSTVAHEYGHAAGPVFFGVGKAGEIRTWEHQTNRARGAAAATQYNFGGMWQNGKWHADKIGSQFNNIMGVLALGGAAEEVLHGIPMKENAGLAGDHLEMRKLMQTLGITDPYQQKVWIETAHRNAVAKFQQPGVPAIFNEFASGRDPQTGRTLHATAARVAEFQDRLREAINGDTRSKEGEAGSGGRSGGPDGVDDGISGPAAGSAEGQTTSQLLSANGSEAGRDRGTGKAERALAPKGSPVGPQAATGNQDKKKPLPNGMVSVGNIDVNHRPVVRNKNGSVSTIFSWTVPTADGKWALVPSIADGKFLTPDGKMPDEKNKAQMGALEQAAIDRYKKTGEHLGIFKTSQAADDFAKATHDWMPTGGPEKVFLPTPKAKASEWFQKDGQWIRHTPDGRLETRSSKPRTQTHTPSRQ